MVQQEKITDKWKKEHRQTCDFFEKSLKHLEVENRMLKARRSATEGTFSTFIHLDLARVQRRRHRRPARGVPVSGGERQCNRHDIVTL